MKIVNIAEEVCISSEDCRIFNEIFTKEVIYDNLHSHEKSGFHPLFGRYIFGETTQQEREEGQFEFYLNFKFLPDVECI